jgi:uncharacterized FlgJ-related protein
MVATMATSNEGLGADMIANTLNKLYGKRTVKYLEIPHYA